MFHINALVVGVLSTLVSGGSLVLDRRFSRRSFWSISQRYCITWVNLVPAIIAILAEATPPPAEVAERIRFARSASAPLAAATLERFEARCGIPVLETYGMTEAASQIAANPLEPERHRPGSVGLPVGVEVRIVDETGRTLAPGAVGMVQIRGDSVIASYWTPVDRNGVAATLPATDRGGWLATGDLGRLDDDGYLYLAGRDDDVINRGGEKIYPREIEEVLLADERVRSAVVVGRPHPVVGEEPVAFVITGPDGAEADGRLVEELAARLPSRPERLQAAHRDHRRRDPAVGTDGQGAARRAAATDRRVGRRFVTVSRRGVAHRSRLGTRRWGRTEPTTQLPPRRPPMTTTVLDLPHRPPKPRRCGLTMMIDSGLPQGYFADVISSGADYIDLVKFGWGTSLVTADLGRKIECLHAHDVRFFFGGTLFEKFVAQDRFDDVPRSLPHLGLRPGRGLERHHRHVEQREGELHTQVRRRLRGGQRGRVQGRPALGGVVARGLGREHRGGPRRRSPPS